MDFEVDSLCFQQHSRLPPIEATREVRQNRGHLVSTHQETSSGVTIEPHRHSMVRPIGYVEVRLSIEAQSVARTDTIQCRSCTTTTSNGETKRLTLDPFHHTEVAIVQDVHIASEIERYGSGGVEFTQTTSTSAVEASNRGTRAAAYGVYGARERSLRISRGVCVRRNELGPNFWMRLFPESTM